MKIKYSSTKADISSLHLIFLIVSFAAVIIRAFQVHSLIEVETGFYKSDSIIIPLLYIFIAVCIVAFMLICYLSKDSARLQSAKIKDTPLCVSCALFAIVFFIDWIKSFTSSFQTGENGYSLSQTDEYTSLMSTGALPLLLRSVFAFLSGIYFLYLASSYKSGSGKVSEHKYLALTPTFWAASRMLSLFISKISFIRVSDLFLELVMLSFMVLFFLAFAQLTSEIYSDTAQWRVCAYGFAAGMIAACLSITRLFFTLIDSEKYINPSHKFDLCDLVFFIFSTVLFVAMYKNKNDESKEVQEVAQEETQE